MNVSRKVCANTIRHAPRPMVLERHHLQPRSWGGPDTDENIVRVCSLCHSNGHTALNACVRHGGIPPREVWELFDAYARWLATEAIRRAGGIVRKYTGPLASEMEAPQ